MFAKLLIFAILAHLSNCLYEDQIGKFDWNKPMLGKAKFSVFEDGSGGKRILVATEQNAVASINVRNGKILWRKVLEEGEEGKITGFCEAKSALVTVSGSTGLKRAWSSSSGTLLWEVSLPEQRSRHASLALLKSDKSRVGVLQSNIVTSLRVKDGKRMWSEELPESASTDYRWLLVSEDTQTAWAVGTDASSAVSVRLRLGDDDVEVGVAQHVPLTSELLPERCVTTVGATPALVCVDAATAQLMRLQLDDQPQLHYTLLQELGVGTSVDLLPVQAASDSLLLRSGCHSRLFSVRSGSLALSLDLPQACAVSVVQHDGSTQPLVVALQAHEKAWTVSVHSLVSRSPLLDFSPLTYSVPHHAAPPNQLLSATVSKRDGALAIRSLALADDHSMRLLGSQGSVLWAREEALASILSVQMLDPPLSAAQASMEDEFDSKADDMFSMLALRLSTQIAQFTGVISDLLRKLHLKAAARGRHSTNSEEEWQPSPGLVRDEFNLRKVIVAATSVGKLFGLDSTDGRLLWAERVSNLAGSGNDVSLYMQRSTAHFPHPAHCLLLGKDLLTGEAAVYAFNPITGQPARGQTPGQAALLGFRPLQTMLLQQTDASRLKPLLVLDDQLLVHVLPPEAVSTVIKPLERSLYMYTADPGKGVLTGYSLTVGESPLSTQETWTISVPSASQRITGVASRRDSEHVHSQGRVLADRSVLYKYLNPNLAVVTTEGQDKTTGPFIGAYIIDTVTGQLLFHTTQKRATGPVHALVSENWVLLSYWNTKSRRTEMAVLEMYEGTSQSNATHFSSLHPPLQPPLIQRQSYILSTRMSAMEVTLTEAGITSKQVIVALKIGSILSLAKALLDPRRPLDLTPAHREEGVLPYIPELPVNNELMPSYNQSVLRVRGLHTAPAGLESTSLVLAYGLDLFFTRLTPSQAFDVLKDDFDFFLIGSVLSAMIAASVISQKLAARKTLNRAWK